jgi:hypothetical protein
MWKIWLAALFAAGIAVVLAWEFVKWVSDETDGLD